MITPFDLNCYRPIPSDHHSPAVIWNDTQSFVEEDLVWNCVKGTLCVQRTGIDGRTTSLTVGNDIIRQYCCHVGTSLFNKSKLHIANLKLIRNLKDVEFQELGECRRNRNWSVVMWQGGIEGRFLQQWNQ